MLVDAELRSDRTWHITGITTPRVGAAINQAIVLQRLNDDGLRSLLGRAATGGGSFPSWRSWEIFRELARSLLTDELNSLIRRSWEGLRQPSPVRVVVSIRAMLLDPDISLAEGEPTPAWLEVVPFDAAAASAAAKLRDGDVTFDVTRTQVSFAPGGDRIEIAVRAAREMLIHECKVVSGDKPLLVAPLARIVRRGTLTALPAIVLPAEAVRGFAANGGSGGEVLLSVRGTKRTFTTSIPVANLPAFSAIADIFLDLGSTNTKWALRLEGKVPVEHDQDTTTLTEVWGIDAYRKVDLLSDPTGERWSEWVARALPALRQWVGREHNAYLRNVHLSLPSTKQFDVSRVAGDLLGGPRGPTAASTTRVRVTYPKGKESRVDLMGSFDHWTTGVPMSLVNGQWEATLDVRAGERILYRFLVDKETWVSDPANPRRTADEHGNSELLIPPEPGAKRLVRAAITEHLVCSGRVALVPEHELVAAHYLGVLRVLQKAALAYAARFASHEDRRRDQAQRRARWNHERAAADAYNASIKWYTFWKWGTHRAGPSGSAPEVAEKIVDPAAWMEDLVAHPEQFDHVVLFDSGGLSLDISVLEKHGLVRELSHSDTRCGGEAISSRIGRRGIGRPGTTYKAQLGIRWRDARDIDTRDQREYRDVTRELHGPVVGPLFESLRARWRRSPHCCVLLTGGGSRNPHLAEYISELASDAGLRANVVDAPTVQDLIRQAREFPEPLQELGSEEVRRFEATQVWSERRERQPLARYDKFAVVGGMCALGGGRL